jgi:F-type H+-transporting ATPase subunit a
MQKRDQRRILTTTLVVLLLTAGAALAQHHEQAADDHHDGHGHAVEAAATDEHHADAAHGDHDDHGDHGGGFHLENIVVLLAGNLLSPEQAAAVGEWLDPIFSLIVALILASWFISVGRSLHDRDPSRKQLFAEMIVGGLYNMFREILGDQARRFAPYLGTLFIFIICNNLFGLVPLGHSSTSSFVNTTLGLGLMTFLYVQYVGIRENGIGGYLYHFAG